MALLFRRLHEALGRNERAFERSEQAFERSEQAFERSERAFERNEQAFADLQVVIRESRIREERALQSLEATVKHLIEHIDRINADADARMQAVRTMLDRWGEGPTAAS